VIAGNCPAINVQHYQGLGPEIKENCPYDGIRCKIRPMSWITGVIILMLWSANSVVLSAIALEEIGRKSGFFRIHWVGIRFSGLLK